MSLRAHADQLALYARSNGAALLICLLLLAALTLLGMAAAWDYTLQERMSNNLIERAQAGHSANSALKWGEAWLMGLQGDSRPSACADDCTATDVIRAGGTYGPAPQHRDLNWWQSNAFTVGTNPEFGTTLDVYLANIISPSFWIIEEIHIDNTKEADSGITETAYYKLLARGSSRQSPGYSITESIIARPWGDAVLTNGFPAPDSTAGFCYLDTVITPCGRQAWQQVQ